VAGLYRESERFGGKKLFARERITYVAPRAAKPANLSATAIYRSKWRSIVATDDLSQRFRKLRDQWSRETEHLSSITQIVLHPAYQQIIGMGPAALPSIFADLANQPHHWFWALNAITGENPVPETDVGDLDAMRRAWFDWARERGHIA
jgi:hypothetical protein